MMKVGVDPARCEGTAFCQAIAADHFRVGDKGVAIVLRAEVAAAALADVEEAVRTCPTGAISLERHPHD
jgi:ferredoxin